MAQMIQADWARIGVKARILTYEWGEYLKRANNGEHHVYMSGWTSDIAAADEFLTPNLTCAASRGGIKFCNAEFDALVEARARRDRRCRSAWRCSNERRRSSSANGRGSRWRIRRSTSRCARTSRAS